MLAELGNYSGIWSLVANAMSALAYTRCSHLTGDAGMRRKGLEMYQNDLVSIRGALDRRNTTFAPETVIAIGIMGLY